MLGIPERYVTDQRIMRCRLALPQTVLRNSVPFVALYVTRIDPEPWSFQFGIGYIDANFSALCGSDLSRGLHEIYEILSEFVHPSRETGSPKQASKNT